MFISDEVIFLELHKTGGTHIGTLLSKLFAGKQVGKHNRLEVNSGDRLVLGSIRNPWDWYVSLWAYGCQKKGAVYHCTTSKLNWSYYYRQLPKEMGCTWLTPAQYCVQLAKDCIKPAKIWATLYSDSNNAANFRTWLKMIFSEKRKFDMREGYGFSCISSQSGLLTYRLFKLFTSFGQNLYKESFKIDSVSDLIDIWNQYKVVDKVIKNENLENDLLNALESSGVILSDAQRTLVINAKNKKSNTSNRREASFYYDEETLALIREKEAFIIEQFGYQELEHSTGKMK